MSIPRAGVAESAAPRSPPDGACFPTRPSSLVSMRTTKRLTPYFDGRTSFRRITTTSAIRRELSGSLRRPVGEARRVANRRKLDFQRRGDGDYLHTVLNS